MTILAGLSTAQAQTQTIATWFSTSTASLIGISTWRSVAYGPTPVTPIPTIWGRPAPPDETAIVREPTASRNINITSWSTVQVTPPGIKTVIVTTTLTTFGISTVSMEGTGISTSYTRITPATISFTPTVCANSDGILPQTTVTRYSGTYTPFPGQFVTTRPRSFPTAVTSTSLFNGLIPVIYTYTAFTTTTTTFWYLGSAVSPTSTLCSPLATPTVNYAAQCAPTNLISQRDDRAVAIIREPKLDTHKWTTQGPNFNSDLMREAFRDASVCCQLCVDNAPGGCVAKPNQPINVEFPSKGYCLRKRSSDPVAQVLKPRQPLR
ncbi:hypothetical protein QBC43DRAFT_337174 [Cladorrhinum sp. PSN259]|nr:hypothetical protein QBC43DRAFT_337174 [Cladorrhinum sp. PSN259]